MRKIDLDSIADEWMDEIPAIVRRKAIKKGYSFNKYWKARERGEKLEDLRNQLIELTNLDKLIIKGGVRNERNKIRKFKA